MSPIWLMLMMRLSAIPFTVASCREDCEEAPVTTSASTTPKDVRSSSTTVLSATEFVPDSIGQLADLVYLKTFHNTFLTAEEDGTMKCDRPENVEWEKFRVIDNGDGSISLLSFHGKFLAAYADGSVMCDRHEIGHWEKWTYEEFDDGRHTLMSYHGKFLSAKAWGTVRADFHNAAPWKSPGMGWESFEVVNDPESLISLRTRHSTYVSAHEDGSITADSFNAGDWERFRLVRHGDDTVSMQTVHGHYLNLHHDGSVTADEEQINEWDKFELITQNGGVNIKSVHNKYLSAKSDGTLKADYHADGAWHSGGPGGWETFNIEMAMIGRMTQPQRVGSEGTEVEDWNYIQQKYSSAKSRSFTINTVVRPSLGGFVFTSGATFTVAAIFLRLFVRRPFQNAAEVGDDDDDGDDDEEGTIEQLLQVRGLRSAFVGEVASVEQDFVPV